MQLFTLQSEVHDRGMTYLDDNDDVIIETFISAHSTPEKAMDFATGVANKEVDLWNDGMLEDGESPMPPLTLTWTRDYLEDGRVRWTSDTYEAFDPTKYTVVETILDPVL